MYSALVIQEVLQRRQESLEDDESGGWPSEVDNDQLRAIIKADPLMTTWEAAEELNIDHSVVIWHLKQIGKVKKLCKWVPHELTENQKNCHFEVSSSLHSTQQQTISWSDCDMQWKVDFIWQVAMTSSVAGLRSSKALPKAKHASEKGPGHCLIVCCLPDPL